jgi:hypothetical protein
MKGYKYHSAGRRSFSDVFHGINTYLLYIIVHYKIHLLNLFLTQ